MRFMARISSALRDYDDCIILRPLMAHKSQAKEQRAGTVLLTNVTVSANIRGEILEVSERRVKPKAEIRAWPKMRYVNTIGSYVDVKDGHKVESAKAVYMVGTQIYYYSEAA